MNVLERLMKCIFFPGGSSLFTFLDSVLDGEFTDDTSSEDTSLDSTPSHTNQRPPVNCIVSLKTDQDLDLTPVSLKTVEQIGWVFDDN